MVMSQVIYIRLKQLYPGCDIDVLAPAATIALAERMPEVRQAILIEQQHGQLGLGYRYRLGVQLRATAYDWCIVTPNSFKSALVPFFAEIPQRTGFLGEYRYVVLTDPRLLDPSRLPRMIDRFVSLTDRDGKLPDEIGLPVLHADRENAKKYIENQSLTASGGVLGLCPGAEFGDAKKWPESSFAEVAKAAISAGRAVWIFGGPADAETGERIAELAGTGCVNLAGKTSLIEAIDLLAHCDDVVTNDSGLMHIAAAVGARITAVYGSTSPDFTPPLADSASVVRTGIECSPCFKRQCPLGHKNCLVELPASDVINVVSPGQ